MDRVLEKIREHSSSTPSRWREKAEYRQANISWIKESRRVALEILSNMRIKGLSRKELSEMSGVSEDTISRLLKGKEIVNEEAVKQIVAALEI